MHDTTLHVDGSQNTARRGLLAAALIAWLCALSATSAWVQDAVCVDPNDPNAVVGSAPGTGNEVACGADAAASGTNAVAVGNASNASGVNTVAVGSGTSASGANAVAIGHLAAASNVCVTHGVG